MKKSVLIILLSAMLFGLLSLNKAINPAVKNCIMEKHENPALMDDINLKE